MMRFNSNKIISAIQKLKNFNFTRKSTVRTKYLAIEAGVTELASLMVCHMSIAVA